MYQTTLSNRKKHDGFDLVIIFLTTLVVLAIFMMFNPQIMAAFANPHIHLLARTVFAALFQFGVAGLGICIVAVWHKESFKNYGLNSKNLLQTILLSILVFIPHILLIVLSGKWAGYMPFKSVMMTKQWLAVGFPGAIAGFAVMAVAWGFFEAFNYVFVNQRIAVRFPSKSYFVRPGAIVCAVFCLLIHGMIGVTPSALLEAVTVFVIIYGMLWIRERTGNAWGCIFLFTFFWNAF